MNDTTITCENCGKGELKIIDLKPGCIIKRGFTGKKGPQYYTGSRKFLTPDCPACGAHHGEKKHDIKNNIERMQRMGLPMIIRSG